jgi:uncharacterized RDD family membrane protein YckC
MEQVQAVQGERQIAGFWRRLAALLIDGMVIGGVGLLLGLVLFDELVRMGAYGRLLGFAIALAYFGTLNSRIGAGQTLGKKLLSVRVVGRDGEPLALRRALVRSVILEVPFFLNGATFSADVLMTAWNYVLALLVFGGMAAVVYLYVFNRRTRQSLHDIAVGSYVVRSDSSGPVAARPVWAGHLVVVLALCIGALSVPMLGNRLLQEAAIAELLPAQATIAGLPGVQGATLGIVRSSAAGGVTTNQVAARLRLAAPGDNNIAFAEQVARTVLAEYPRAAGKDRISVELVYGYDIGIASSWTYAKYAFEPAALAEPR